MELPLGGGRPGGKREELCGVGSLIQAEDHDALEVVVRRTERVPVDRVAIF